ncbi:hypothetical protein VTL71DRAFT_10028 [Oculimacula yallundae]|uniref:Histone-lysine N-methyltransferase SET5 n=1 Tax=Oculimacula yallundae TaxID=86028 RepID=A0ABR4BT82_9HELO
MYLQGFVTVTDTVRDKGVSADTHGSGTTVILHENVTGVHLCKRRRDRGNSHSRRNMERTWISRLWRASSLHQPNPPHGIMGTVDVAKVSKSISQSTIELALQPYNATLWAARAEKLVRAGYPELAVGDARKAQKLAQAMLHSQQELPLHDNAAPCSPTSPALTTLARTQYMDGAPLYVCLGLRLHELQHGALSWARPVKNLHWRNFPVMLDALVQMNAWFDCREMCIGRLIFLFIARSEGQGGGMGWDEMNQDGLRWMKIEEERPVLMSYEHVAEAQALYPEDSRFAKARFPMPFLHTNYFIQNSLSESTRLMRELNQSIPPDIRSTLDRDAITRFEKAGEVVAVCYPFMPPQYMHRGEEIIAGVNKRLKKQRARCVVRPSALCNSFKAEPELDPERDGSEDSLDRAVSWGVFATEDISMGEVVFRDTATWCAHNGSDGSAGAVEYVKNRGGSGGRGVKTVLRCDNCCGVIPVGKEDQNKVSQVMEKDFSCLSPSCLKTAQETYHKVLCGKDFSWLNHADNSQIKNTKSSPGKQTQGIDPESIAEGRMWLRILATCVQSGLHPLEHPSIAALTANYTTPDSGSYLDSKRSPMPHRWAMSIHIDIPQRILTELGIDIYTDTRYDTWVLQTIWWRMSNNMFGGSEDSSSVSGPRPGLYPASGINAAATPASESHFVGQLYSFLNHSCESNVGLLEQSGGQDQRQGYNSNDSYRSRSKSVAAAVAPPSPVRSSKISVVATRDIRAGEELYTSYIDTENADREERNEMLRKWLEGDCQCTRCRRETRNRE